MSQDIVQEVVFFLHSILMGLVITFAYDWILVFRKLFTHGRFLISLEDLLYWFVCGIGVFYMLYKENNGVLSCAKTRKMAILRHSKVCSIDCEETEKSKGIYKKTVDGLAENN